MEHRELDVDGVALRWVEAGDGFPVVMIHGIPTGPALWRHVIPRVPARCLAWEMVGYGDSIPAGRDRDISVGAQAGHLLRWLDALGLDRVVLVGHDLGGGVAQIAAVREPQRCAGLVLTNSVAYDSWPVPSVKAMGRAGGLVGRLPDAAFRLVIASFLRLGHDDTAGAREALGVHWPPYARHGGAAAMIRQVRSLDPADTLAVADRLPTLGVPARVVWGTGDRFQPPEVGHRLAHDLGTELHPIEGAKHWTPEDHPAEIAVAIGEVLAQVTGFAP